ncbi:MAG: radical SAM family heme chaperone HemW [Woeseiaceae bacterium]|nr:radical SAM family heme chaperone HemW [Woeseiaceae bacterium]
MAWHDPARAPRRRRLRLRPAVLRARVRLQFGGTGARRKERAQSSRPGVSQAGRADRTAVRVNPPPLSLYVHLPWCVRKCPYCDFNSHSARDGGAPTARYVDALLVDIEREARHANGREIETIFLGGGTPTLFAPGDIGRLLDGVAGRLSFAPDIEITMEANPGTVECGSPAAYRATGVNRLSIGAQSFDDASLRRLGRIHGSADIRSTVEASVQGGFETFNLDLMYGLPQQTVAMAVADLRAAVDLAAPHISWYQLTLEPNTVFHARPPAGLPDDEAAWAIQVAGAQVLADAGYTSYEVSAWARGAHRCRHNLNYWRFGDYLAVGAGAHGKRTEGEAVLRYRKPANPLAYMQAMEAAEEAVAARVLDEADLVFEFMLNASRLTEGFSEDLFTRRTGLAASVLAAAGAPALEGGLIERREGDAWHPTALGRRFLDDLQASFLP